MMRNLRLIPTLAAVVGASHFCAAFELKNGPFDGSPFRPTVPVTWAANSPTPEGFAVFKIPAVKAPQSIISNAMTIGTFKPINLVKSKENGVIEFRDRPGEDDWTRFLKMSASQGWVKYYDKLAGGRPARGVPGFEEIQKQALRLFVLLGGDTNQLPPKPWPHNESTFQTYDKPGGNLISKGVSRRSICLFRQVDGIPVMGNSLSVDFGNDAKPITLEMNWPPLNPVQRFRVATKDEMLALIKSGKAFIQVFPPPPEDISPAKSYKVKNVVPLYAELSSEGERLMKPYGSLLVEADVNGRAVEFVVNCPILTDEKTR
jgi:hypothetical protein